MPGVKRNTAAWQPAPAKRQKAEGEGGAAGGAAAAVPSDTEGPSAMDVDGSGSPAGASAQGGGPCLPGPFPRLEAYCAEHDVEAAYQVRCGGWGWEWGGAPARSHACTATAMVAQSMRVSACWWKALDSICDDELVCCVVWYITYTQMYLCVLAG